jgi:uncharacterized DUF497 family protein
MADGFVWNSDKNRELLELRGVDFPMVLQALADGDLLDDLAHPGKGREHQRIMVIWMKGDVFVVPYVQDQQAKFLKTIFPSRKFRQMYGGQDGKS